MRVTIGGTLGKPLLWALGGLLVLSGLPSSAHSTPLWDDIPCRSTDYYEFPMVTTKNVPGTGRSSAVGRVTFTHSPFMVSIGADGSYLYDVALSGVNLPVPRDGVFVAWAMTPEIDQVQRLGVLDKRMQVSGAVTWNKFLVAITMEPSDDPEATRWSGPIVLRGVSRSGLMHTLAGHGPLEQELCAKYGFGN